MGDLTLSTIKPSILSSQPSTLKSLTVPTHRASFLNPHPSTLPFRPQALNLEPSNIDNRDPNPQNPPLTTHHHNPHLAHLSDP
jgi:hypothetical protein